MYVRVIRADPHVDPVRAGGRERAGAVAQAARYDLGFTVAAALTLAAAAAAIITQQIPVESSLGWLVTASRYFLICVERQARLR